MHCSVFPEESLMKKTRKILSVLLCLGMLAQHVPTLALGAETDGFCPHHQSHTEQCGWAAEVTEVRCTHEHTDACYIVCVHTSHDETCGGTEDPSACTHSCSAASGCVTEAPNCTHTDDGSCCYVAPKAEVPCGFAAVGCAECQTAAANTPDALLTGTAVEGWYPSARLDAPEGYQISDAADGTYSASLAFADGTHTSRDYWLILADTQYAKPVQRTWTGSIQVDGTAPTVTHSVPADSVTQTAASLLVEATDSGSGVASYALTCADSAVTVGTFADGKFDISNMAPNKSYPFTLTVTDLAGNAYRNEEIRIQTKPIDISAAAVTVSGEYIYTGSAQTVAPENVTVKLGDTVISAEFTFAYTDNVNAGTATVKVTVTGESEYAGTATGTFTIRKKALSVTAAENAAVTYGASLESTQFTADGLAPEHTVTVTAAACETPALTAAVKDGNGNDVTANYDITCSCNTLTVNPLPVTLEWSNLTDRTYGDGKTVTAAVTNALDGDDVQVTVTGGSETAAGTHTATATALTGTDAANYTLESQQVQYTVAKADPTVTAPTARTLTYTGGALVLVNPGSTTGGTLKYSIAQDGTYSITIPVGENAGTYTVWYMAEGNDNFNSSAPASVTVTVARATVTVTANDKTAMKYAEKPELTYSVSGLRGQDQLTGQIVLTCNADMTTAGEYTITPSGGSVGENYTLQYVNGKLTVREFDDLAQGLPTADTVTLADKDDIETVQEQAEGILEDNGTALSAEEKAELEAIVEDCDDLLVMIGKAEAVLEETEDRPSSGRVLPDNKTAIDAYDHALASWNALSANEKRMIPEAKTTLDGLNRALTAYDIISRSSSYHVKTSGKTLTITGNGYYAALDSYAQGAYGKFLRLEIDGKTVESKHYTVKAGSTVITLTSSYLDSLSTGKHTVKLIYTDGTTDGTDSFTIYVSNGIPFTGDSSHITGLVWVAVLSGLAAAALIIYGIRKKRK